MDYKLAKQLKDAGFPQEGRDYLCPDSCKEPSMWHDNHTVLLPTLSELIEACGDGKRIVLYGPGTVDQGEWYWGPSETQWFVYYQYPGKGMKSEEGFGSSPEEAVARLWLELNK